MIDPGPAPLPARSVLLSVLLGSHPPELPVRTLVRTAEMFGISEGTARVALSRLTADGEVVADGGSYALSPRHLERQYDQDIALRPATRPWRGGWYLVVEAPGPARRTPSPPNGPAAAAELRRNMERRRLAELRAGVWTRPDNLDWPASDVPDGLLRWSGRPAAEGPSDRELAARLWDLEGWAAGAETLLRHLRGAEEPALRLSVAAAMVRHIRADPVLPPGLLPVGWPGRRLRRAYDAYRVELGRLIGGLRED